MKSNEHRSGDGLAWVFVVVAFASIGAVRAPAVERYRKVADATDVYALPPPDQAVVASLGYRAALADLLYSYLLVAYGTHISERRPLEFVGDYIDTINALDPSFREPYRFADTFVVYEPGTPKLEQWQKTREILRRGLRNRPFDTELWSSAGQYLAYVAPPHLPTPELEREFKLEGARVLARACELTGNNQNIAYQCMTAAHLFSSAGEREAAIDAAQRLLQVTDDPVVEQQELAYLKKRLDEREADRLTHRRELFRAAWMADLPFVSKNKLLVLGPRFDAPACAGLARVDQPDCAASWKSWARENDPEGR